MAIVASKDRTRDYILKADRGTSNPTTFKIGVLSYRQAREIESLVADAMEISPGDLQNVIKDSSDESASKAVASAKLKPGFLKALNEAQALKVRYGVKGWLNLMDEDGRPFVYTTDKQRPDIMAESCLDGLQPFIAELAEAVDSVNSLTRADQKN